MNVYFCFLGLLAKIKRYITLSCSQIYLVKSQRTGFSSDQSLSLLSSLFVRANQNFGIPYDWLEMKTVAKFHLLQMHKKFIICLTQLFWLFLADFWWILSKNYGDFLSYKINRIQFHRTIPTKCTMKFYCSAFGSPINFWTKLVILDNSESTDIILKYVLYCKSFHDF